MTRIRDYMSLPPVMVDQACSLAEALETMERHRIRHLPVLDDGRLIGVLSERDIYRLESRKRVDPEVMTVAEAMNPDPYTAAPHEPLSQVLRNMAALDRDCALVVDDDEVMGLVTSTDAMEMLASILWQREQGCDRSAG